MPAMSFHAGDRLGKYELVRELGKGGFASVWLARLAGPHGFEQNVAIKLIRTDFGTDPTFQKMFVDEARLAAMVNHPNVVHIFELGQERDLLYLVMEYVRGRPLNVLRNLAEREGRQIPIPIVMRILADTCAGLHAAHELTREGRTLGVIHRDVSPHNILVSDRGNAKLIDFGIAKANDRLAGDTATGLAKGKIRYMAPEQALAKSLDRRVDIWSVGAVAYDLLEGHPPYDGPNDLARMYALLGTQPPAALSRSVPPAIERVISRALAREPKNRFGTAQEMKAAIEAALETSTMRASADEVAAFFAAWLTSQALEDGDVSDASNVRQRLALAQRRSVRTETVDVAPPPPPSTDAIETLSAIDSSIVPGVRPHKRMWIAMAATALIALGVAGTWRLSSRHGPSDGAAATPAVSAPPVPQSPPADSAPAVPAPDPPDDRAVDLDAIPTSSATAKPPRAKPRGPRAPAPSKPRAAPSSRPRYDDTIQ
jgi:eukaryotic-like serine/threonine-protein kinase